VWRVFADATALRAVVAGLVTPWLGAEVTHVLGIESRGFLLGGAAAVALDAGSSPCASPAPGCCPGPKVRTTTGEDYRGLTHDLRMQQVVGPGDRVLMVDDWAERGSQAVAARAMVEQCRAHWVGLAVVVDQLAGERRAALGRVTRLVDAHELGPAGAG
jgi:adenine/guanine phosphoribosyltransferase-like PRPP-binding protein